MEGPTKGNVALRHHHVCSLLKIDLNVPIKVWLNQWMLLKVENVQLNRQHRITKCLEQPCLIKFQEESSMEVSLAHHPIITEEESELAQFVAEVSEIGYGKTGNKLRVWWRKLPVRKVY